MSKVQILYTVCSATSRVQTLVQKLFCLIQGTVLSWSTTKNVLMLYTSWSAVSTNKRSFTKAHYTYSKSTNFFH